MVSAASATRPTLIRRIGEFPRACTSRSASRSGRETSETDAPATIVYKRYENALPPASEPDGDPSEFEQAVDKFAATVERALADDARELAELRAKVATLEAKVEMLTALLGQKSAKLWTPGNGT